ncbi:hypothetical protein GCM10010980_10790 [Corynebacterium marinum]|nr:hypothetical protein GCM10010980_10790 [Corynebacterium marinum]
MLGGGDVAEEILQIHGNAAAPGVLDDGVAAVETHGRALLREGAAQCRAELTCPAPRETGEVVVGEVPLTERVDTAQNHQDRDYPQPDDTAPENVHLSAKVH